PFVTMTPEQREAADDDFLSEDLQTRLAAGPLRWDMVVTVADAGDAILDASTPWPEARRHVTVGSVVVEHTSPQTTGACRDINFDPLVLPTGVESSGDPVLAARSAVYSVSFNRRERDIASGKAGAAIGQSPAKVDAQ
ncbi:MAG: catalase, partial [Thermomonas sp.]